MPATTDLEGNHMNKSSQSVEKRPVGRPSKLTVMVPQRTLDERARAVNNYHNSAAAAYAQASFYAVLCGLELMAARNSVPHGEWLPWVERNCEFERMTAHRYMALADKALPVIQKRYPDLLNGAAQVAPSLMLADSRKRLISAVSEMTDHRTIQELQLELGIIKPKVEGTPGGANNPYGRAGNPATVLERAELEKALAIKEWGDVCRMALTNCQKKSYGHLEKLKVRQVMETLRSVADELESFIERF
jgi:hypothetical protein